MKKGKMIRISALFAVNALLISSCRDEVLRYNIEHKIDNLTSYEMDSLGVITINGTDIYKADSKDYPNVSAYWLMASQEIDDETHEIKIKSVVVSRATSGNVDISDANSWKSKNRIEYRSDTCEQFNNLERSILLRVSPLKSDIINYKITTYAYSR